MKVFNSHAHFGQLFHITVYYKKNVLVHNPNTTKASYKPKLIGYNIRLQMGKQYTEACFNSSWKNLLF